MLNTQFWRNRRVLLTGHTGFKGSWMALWLQHLGADLTGYALPPPTEPSLFDLAHVAQSMRSVEADILDLERLQRCLRDTKPEIVLHFAAQSLVRRSFREPLETYAVNVLGTANVLEAARGAAEVRAIVVVTSDKCYDNQESGRLYAEGDPLGGRDPYSSSKACAEHVASAYRSSFGSDRLRIASGRAGNVIGGGDWSEERLVPDIARALLDGQPVRIRNPKAVRPWQHVLAPLQGYLMLAERLCGADGAAFAEAWNFGPEPSEARAVEAVVSALLHLWQPAGCWEEDASEHPREAQQLNLDSSKAQNRLGWKPAIDLETAFAWTMDWYRAYQSKADLRLATTSQLAQYQQMLSS